MSLINLTEILWENLEWNILQFLSPDNYMNLYTVNKKLFIQHKMYNKFTLKKISNNNQDVYSYLSKGLRYWWINNKFYFIVNAVSNHNTRFTIMTKCGNTIEFGKFKDIKVLVKSYPVKYKYRPLKVSSYN